MTTLQLVERTAPRKRRSEVDVPAVLRFLELLWAVAHGLERTSKRMARELGVTGPQRLVLRMVGLFPGLSAGDLAAVLHVHASTATGMLRRLEQQGLLSRIQDPVDRRRVVLRLTKRGVRANLVRAGTVESAVAGALESLDPRDHVAAARVLERLAERLEASADEPPRATMRRVPRRARRPHPA